MTNEEAERLNSIRASAESKLDELASELTLVSDLGNQARAEANRNVNSWQSWVGAISFSLAAISGIVLYGELDNYAALLATIIFLGTGVSITLVTKKRVEKESATATMHSDAYRPLVEREKELAWRIYADPFRYEELNPLLEDAKAAKIKYSLNETKEVIAEYKKAGIDYTSDIWLASMTTGIYLLLVQTGLDFYWNLGLSQGLALPIFVLPWVLLMLIILNDAIKGSVLARSSNEAQLKRWKQQEKTYKTYLEALSSK
jgi:hypothetical protein